MLNASNKPPSFFFSVRFLFAILTFFAVTIQFTHKTNISVGIICMVNHTALKNNNNTKELGVFHKTKIFNKNPICAFQNETEKRDPDGPFVWSKTTQEILISSYFVGYVLTQVVGGLLSKIIKPNNIFLISMFFGSIFTMLNAVAANFGVAALFICRFLTGAFEGLIWPNMMGIWATWAPSNEKGRLIGISASGSQIGTIIGFSFGGYLCIHGFDKGWPSIFYIFGFSGVIWSIFWYFLSSESPNTHKFISEAEKAYIISETNQTKLELIKKRTIPWKSIFTSKNCISLFISHSCITFGVLLFLTNVPTYMKEVLKFDIQSNGLLSSAPYICIFVSILVSSFGSDKLIKSGKISRTNVRRLFNGLGFFGPGVFLIGLSLIKCDRPYVAVIFLMISLGFGGFANGGLIISFSDVAGSFSGIVFGISNTFSSINGILVPYIVAFVTKDETQEEWMIMFLIASAIFVIGGLCATVFGPTKLEKWVLEADELDYENIIQ